MPAYCTPADLGSLGIRFEALRGITPEDLHLAIQVASDEIDGYLGSRYELPLKAWSNDLRRYCAKLAVYDLIVARGFNPSRAGDEQIRLGREDAVQWLHRVSNGEVVPRLTDSSGGGVGSVSGGAQVSSFESRGYTPDRGGGGFGFTGRRRT